MVKGPNAEGLIRARLRSQQRAQLRTPASSDSVQSSASKDAQRHAVPPQTFDQEKGGYSTGDEATTDEAWHCWHATVHLRSPQM